jgi:hypothetical protein
MKNAAAIHAMQTEDATEIKHYFLDSREVLPISPKHASNNYVVNNRDFGASAGVKMLISYSMNSSTTTSGIYHI